MCRGFGLIVTKDRKYLFCEPNIAGDVSHSIILDRAGIKENSDVFNRVFVRIEFADWTSDSFRFDEDDTLPAWVDEEEVRNRCEKVLSRVAPAWAECVKVFTEARNIRDKALGTALVKQSKAIADKAWDEYLKAFNAAYAEVIARISTMDGYVAKAGHR